MVLVIMIIIGPRIHNSFSCKTRLLRFPGAFHHYMDARRRRIEAPESLCSSMTRDAVNPGIRANRLSIWADRSSTQVNPPSVWRGDPNTQLNPPSIWVDPNKICPVAEMTILWTLVAEAQMGYRRMTKMRIVHGRAEKYSADHGLLRLGLLRLCSSQDLRHSLSLFLPLLQLPDPISMANLTDWAALSA